jgi:hypothetical protein
MLFGLGKKEAGENPERVRRRNYRLPFRHGFRKTMKAIGLVKPRRRKSAQVLAGRLCPTDGYSRETGCLSPKKIKYKGEM